MAKTLMLSLGVVLIVVLLWVFRPDPGQGSQPLFLSDPEQLRRGDDPTYAEELKTLSALLQQMRYELQEQERQRERDQRELGERLRRETEAAVRRVQEDNRRLSEALSRARDELERQIRTSDERSTTRALQAELERLRQAQGELTGELERLRTERIESADRVEERSSAAVPEITEESAESEVEANRVLRASAITEQLRAERDRLRVETDPQALEQLRRIPGMADIAQSLAERTQLGSEPPTAPTTSHTDYVTIHPYVAGGGRLERRPPTPMPHPALPFSINQGRDGLSAVIPVHTLPDAATLVENSTMTPLIGRVPFAGRLTDPYRFKLITGATNLASNGHHIPGIVNAVWSGYAVGVREQSCVRAYVDTVTFTFEDGRLHTVNRGKGSDEAYASVNDTLGYLTDAWGKPCIRGALIDNASAYLRGRGTAAFLDGLANAYARSQVTLQRDALGGVSAYVDGNTYEFALSQGISGTSGEIADYVRERAIGAFDVVYVPPGINVQVFVETQIPIDYDTRGRKVQYHYALETFDD